MKDGVYNISHYDYEIPPALIAQKPASPRDTSNLLVASRRDKTVVKKHFKDIIDYFYAGDVLVLNNTEVIRARLFAKTSSGSKLEVLLLREQNDGQWEALVKPAKRARAGTVISFHQDRFKATITGVTGAGSRMLCFETEAAECVIAAAGQVPLPPYIKQTIDDPRDYQTVYASKRGAVAAPTAGLHFSEALLEDISKKGVTIVYVTLHCGLATFRPVKTADIRDHVIESEWIEASEATCETINRAKADKRRIVAVGTTAVRTLESIAGGNNNADFLVHPFCGETRLYITPGYRFKIVDALITNFHTPRSTNLILVAVFSGLELTQSAYRYAISSNFRFFSFGDAMLIY